MKISIMKALNYRILSLLAAIFAFSTPALASDEPVPTELGLRDAATPQMERIVSFHEDLLLWIITAIVIFVFALMIWIMLRYNSKANPTPSKTTHNVPLEVVWTVVPVLILIVIAVPSFKVLFYLDRAPEPEMTLKVTGYQWYWGYEYPDHDNISFLSYMVPEDEIDEEAGQRRLLSTDNIVYLPTDTNIQIVVTAADVLHAWTVPAFGVKKDAVPGRLNEMWVRIEKPGVYYGQCSELCGKDHAFMPIEVKAVPKEEFDAWVAKAKVEFAANGYQPIQLAKYEGVE